MRRKLFILAVSTMILLTACAGDVSSKTEEQRQVSGSPDLADAYQAGDEYA